MSGPVFAISVAQIKFFSLRFSLPHCKSCQFAEAANPSTLVCKSLKSIKDLQEPAVGLQLPVAVRKAGKNGPYVH